MRKNDSISRTDFKILILFLSGLLFMIVINFIDLSLFNSQLANEMILNSMSRLLGGIIFLLAMLLIGYKKAFKINSPLSQSLLIILPAFIIAVNNFPIIAYFDGRASITEPVYTIYIFILECLSIAFFEELVFRGIILLLLLKKLPKNRKGMYLSVFISSAIFALVHIINLFGGASISDTLLQVGYSFLMGLMWAIIYLKTKNIWASVLLHSAYNFFGLVLFKLGYVSGRFDNTTLIITVLLAIAVAIYILLISLKIDVRKLELLYEIEN